MDTGLSQYEQIKVGNMTRRTSGTAIAGLVVGVGAVVAAVGVGAWASAKASEARRVALAKNEGTEALLNRLALQMATEHTDRMQGQINLSQTITDTISGQQSASQNQSTSVDNAVSQVMSQTFADAITGRSSLNATPVQLYSAPQPCGCPGGCGCNGGF